MKIGKIGKSGKGKWERRKGERGKWERGKYDFKKILSKRGGGIIKCWNKAGAWCRQVSWWDIRGIQANYIRQRRA